MKGTKIGLDCRSPIQAVQLNSTVTTIPLILILENCNQSTPSYYLPEFTDPTCQAQ